MERVTYPKGHILFAEGDPSHFAFRLIAGTAEVSKPALDNRIIGTCHAGDFVGEMGVVLGVPRSATVTFLSEATVEQLSREDFLNLIATNKRQSLRLLHTLSFRSRALIELLGEHLRATDCQGLDRSLAPKWYRSMLQAIKTVVTWLRMRLKFVPDAFPQEAIKVPVETALHTRERFVKAGTTIFSEGSPSQLIYLIKSGTISVTKNINNQQKTIGLGKPGEFLGEIGVLENLPRTATATAETEVIVEVLPEGAFYELISRYPRIFFSTVDTLTERAHGLTEKLKNSGHNLDDQTVYGLLSSVECLVQLTEHRVAHEAERIQNFFYVQAAYGREMLDVYQRFLKGRASDKEMAIANAHFRNYLKMAGLSVIFMMPGKIITLPLAVKLGQTFGVNILPTPPLRNAPQGLEETEPEYQQQI